MKYLQILLVVLLFMCSKSYAQVQVYDTAIKGSIVNFLKWHKEGKEHKPGEYYFVPRYDGTGDAKRYFDRDSLELYYNNFRHSGLVSELYIVQLKQYFNYYEKFLGDKPESGDMIKIEGLDQDIVLNTFEPEEILKNLGRSKITKILVIYNKALVAMNFKKNVDMIFQLTKTNNKWLIDYIGADNTNKNSIFSQ